jgi:2-keto-4-pentenoate hydratase/2-oxohepta-3-ene-1,7-dioic acid hydratase in catechol pathway
VVAGGADALDRVQRWLYDPPWGEVSKAADVNLRAPLLRPPKIVCVGLNYRAHALESKMEIPQVPTIFAKFPTAAIGCGEPIVLPRIPPSPITRRSWHSSSASTAATFRPSTGATTSSATRISTTSARAISRCKPRNGRSARPSTPSRPWDRLSSPPTRSPTRTALDISTTINGEVLQHSNTNDLIFKIPELIAHLSSVFTLEPGDVIATGTPSGVGFARHPPRWLMAGDEVVIRVEGLGDLRNPVVAEE